jgi:hypothetical protein
MINRAHSARDTPLIPLGNLALIICGLAWIGCIPSADEDEFPPDLQVGPATIRIGTEGEPGILFGSIGDVDLRQDQSLLVVDPVSAMVWHLDDHGNLISTFGGRGDGPGEFQTPIELTLIDENEYIVLDADRFRLTRVRIRGTLHEYIDEIPINFQALHICSQRHDLILDPYTGADALVRLDSAGATIASYGTLPGVVDAAFGPEGQEFLRNRLGMGMPICFPNGGIAFLPEWDPTIHVFAQDGDATATFELIEHATLRWKLGDEARPEPVLSPKGWVHRAVSFNHYGDDLLVAQLAAFGGTQNGRDDDPIEVRIIRLSDGAQATFEMRLPRIAHIAEGFAWAWSNTPYPHLVRFPFTISDR